MNLFIVESPFQLLSAVEVNNYFGNEKNILIIKYSPEKLAESNNQQLRLLKNYINWENIYEIDNSLSYFISNLKLLLFIKTIQKELAKDNIDKIFIGEYRSWYMRQYFNILNPKKCFSLDDGNITIELAKSYIPTGKEYKFPKTYKSIIKNIINNFLLLLLFYRVPKKRIDIDLFTCFDVKQFLEKDRYIEHSFEYLKEKNKMKDILENTVYFFGGNLSELDLISEQEEIKLLKSIFYYFNNKNIKMVYLPHRRESSKKLEFIKNSFGIELRYSKYPAEIEFTLMKEIPQYLASIVSTALHTVSKIVSFDETIAFQLPLNKINKIYLEDIVTTYEEYKKTMKVIDLNDIN
ncbi:hypothetical protein ACOL3F_07695 [Aliarcobacter butzleri]